MKKLFLYCSLLLISLSAFSQKGKSSYNECLDKNFKLTERKEAVFFKYVKKDSLGKYQLRMYRKKRVPYLMGSYWDYECQIPDGLIITYHHEGTVKDSAYFEKGKLKGLVKGFYSKGTPKRIEKYQNDSLLEWKHISWEGHDTILRPYRCLPEYKGGNKELSLFIRNNIDYPRDAALKGIQGVVLVGFVVSQEGKVKSSKVLQSPCSLFNYEAERIIRQTSGNWLPGQDFGESIEVGITVPVFFTLQE